MQAFALRGRECVYGDDLQRLLGRTVVLVSISCCFFDHFWSYPPPLQRCKNIIVLSCIGLLLAFSMKVHRSRPSRSTFSVPLQFVPGLWKSFASKYWFCRLRRARNERWGLTIVDCSVLSVCKHERSGPCAVLFKTGKLPGLARIALFEWPSRYSGRNDL